MLDKLPVIPSQS
uniref:Uncharacterized protein n=1 Tax=Arundo donax TaxID=35708 RepID=A0A0A9BPU6_ARUDO